MAIEVILPRVDMDMAEGRIVQWHAADGDAVAKGQALFEIETDKATMEIEAPGSGILRRLPVEGVMPVGSTVAWICAPGEAVAIAHSDDEAGIATAPLVVAEAPVPEAAPPPPPCGTGATPLARRLARQHAIALDSVVGSGPRQRIQARDVTAAAAPPPAAEIPALAPNVAPDVAPNVARDSAPVAPEARPKSSGEVSVKVSRDALGIVPAVARASQPGSLHRTWLRRGSGRPLVLVHGFGAELNGWRPLVSSLPPGRSVLAIDLPGHGRSPMMTPSLTHFADALAATLAAESVEAADLVAHSLGAAVAVRLAEQAALDIRSLLLLSPAGLGPDINGAFIDGLARARGEASLGPWLRLLVSDEAMLGDGFVRAAARLRDETTIAAQLDVARAFFPDGTQAYSVRDALARLAMPVRVVVGVEDRIIPWRHALDLGAVALHVFRGVGHMPQLEIRAALARIMADHARD